MNHPFKIKVIQELDKAVSEFFGNGSVEILFSSESLPRICCLEGDPLSPPEGEAAQGVHPLTPYSFGGFQQSLGNSNESVSGTSVTDIQIRMR